MLELNCKLEGGNMEFMKNKKGFTLVELLAVIVILAIVMGIAAYSMQGVTENVRISSMKSSALSIIDGVRKELLSNMNLDDLDFCRNCAIQVSEKLVVPLTKPEELGI